MDMEVRIFVLFIFRLGDEVAHFVEKHLCKNLKALDSYKKKEFKTALEECFMKMDELMKSPKHKSEFTASEDKEDDGANG